MSTTLTPKQGLGSLLRGLFAQQRDHIEAFFSEVDLDQTEKVLQAILDCQGVVFFSGVGKSGAVAQKIATTFTSVGTRALFLSPMDTLHGDIGIVTDHDLVVLLSKSGESEELIKLVPFIRAKGARVIALVSKPSSRLGHLADLLMLLPLKKELCPFDLAPTTSAVLQLIFGDILAVALMQAKGFSLNEYAKNHPAGRIGKQMTLKVRDLMISGKRLPLCRPEERLSEILGDFSAKGCGCMLIVDGEQRLLGIFTDGDLRRALQAKQADVLDKPLGELMTANPRCTEAGLLAYEAMKLMEASSLRPVYFLPVLEEGKVCGLIQMHALVQAGL